MHIGSKGKVYYEVVVAVHFKDGTQERKGFVLEISEHGPVKLTYLRRSACVINEGAPKRLHGNDISETV